MKKTFGFEPSWLIIYLCEQNFLCQIWFQLIKKYKTAFLKWYPFLVDWIGENIYLVSYYFSAELIAIYYIGTEEVHNYISSYFYITLNGQWW